MPMPTPKPAHIVYRTRRMAEMLHWYETVFGSRIVYSNPAMAFGTWDDDYHRVAFIDLETVSPGGAVVSQDPVGVDHGAYDLPSMRGFLGLTDGGWKIIGGMCAPLDAATSG